LVWNRFLATTESYAHPQYKQKIVEMGDELGTEHTLVFGRARWPGAAHRVLKTPFFETWKHKIAADETELGQPSIGRTIIFEHVRY
jgi:NAD(P)H-dependent flavin oxidoreductase YrpB (nitropropane dioxygenase family)